MANLRASRLHAKCWPSGERKNFLSLRKSSNDLGFVNSSHDFDWSIQPAGRSSHFPAIRQRLWGDPDHLPLSLFVWHLNNSSHVPFNTLRWIWLTGKNLLEYFHDIANVLLCVLAIGHHIVCGVLGRLEQVPLFRKKKAVELALKTRYSAKKNHWQCYQPIQVKF